MGWWSRRRGSPPASAAGPPASAASAASRPDTWGPALDRLAADLQVGPAALAKARHVLAEAARDPPPRAALAPAASLCIGAALAGEPRDEAEVAAAAGSSTLALREAVEWVAGRIDVGILLPEGPDGRRRRRGFDPPRGPGGARP